MATCVFIKYKKERSPEKRRAVRFPPTTAVPPRAPSRFCSCSCGALHARSSSCACGPPEGGGGAPSSAREHASCRCQPNVPCNQVTAHFSRWRVLSIPEGHPERGRGTAEGGGVGGCVCQRACCCLLVHRGCIMAALRCCTRPFDSAWWKKGCTGAGTRRCVTFVS